MVVVPSAAGPEDRPRYCRTVGGWWDRSVRDAHAEAGAVDVGACSTLIGEPVRYALIAIRGDRAVDSTGIARALAAMRRVVEVLARMEWWQGGPERSVVPRVPRALAVTHDSIIELALGERRDPIVVTARYPRPVVRIVRRDPYWYRLSIEGQRFWVRRDLGRQLRAHAATWPAQ